MKKITLALLAASVNASALNPNLAAFKTLQQVMNKLEATDFLDYLFTFDGIEYVDQSRWDNIVFTSRLGCEIRVKVTFIDTGRVIYEAPPVDKVEVVSAQKSRDPRIKDRRGCAKEKRTAYSSRLSEFSGPEISR
jgi:hypothetical protein